MICIQKIYGFHGLNHQIINKSWDVTPVTYGRTHGGGGKWKIGQCSVRPETAIKYKVSEWVSNLVSKWLHECVRQTHCFLLSCCPWVTRRTTKKGYICLIPLTHKVHTKICAISSLTDGLIWNGCCIQIVWIVFIFENERLFVWSWHSIILH